MLTENGAKQDALAKLADLANLRGGHDNITAVLLLAGGEELFELEDPGDSDQD